MLELSSFANAKLVPCVAKPSAFGNMVDDRLEQGLHWLFDQLDRSYETLNTRVQADLAVKKAQDEKRRTEQRARVSAWREERELRDMGLHDKPSFAAASGSSSSIATSATGAGEAYVATLTKPEPENDVIRCSTCTTAPAVTKCAASKWMPVCAECASELKCASSRNQ